MYNITPSAQKKRILLPDNIGPPVLHKYHTAR